MQDEPLLFDQNLKKIHPFFRFGGINIKTGEISQSEFIKSRIIYIINFFWLNMDLAGGIYWFIDGVIRGKDFLGLTYIAPCISFSTIAVIKGHMLIMNEKHVHKLIEVLRILEKREREREFTTEKEEIINKERKFLNNVINVISFLYLIVIITFATGPIIIMLTIYLNSSELELTLPFLILYPFDPFQIKVYPFVYLHQVWTECIVSLFFLSADLFFFTCCTYIRIQFKLLQYSISNIIPKNKSIDWKFRDDDDFKAKFKELIMWHQDLIGAVNILENIYNKSTLLNFLSSSMTICLTGFNVTMVKDVAFIVVFLSFLFMSLFQVFFLCFFADLVMVASTEISDAVYKTQWYMADPSVGKKLLIMQTRGQTPCKLTAFGYADVNLNLFMRVLSTAWSYFALLQTIYGN